MSRISRRLQVHWRGIVIAMTGLMLLAQLVLAVHGVVHLASAGQDHCEIAQVAHAVAAQLPSVPFQVIVSPFHQPPQAGVLPAFMQSEPRHGPPIRAPPLYSWFPNESFSSANLFIDGWWRSYAFAYPRWEFYMRRDSFRATANLRARLFGFSGALIGKFPAGFVLRVQHGPALP